MTALLKDLVSTPLRVRVEVQNYFDVPPPERQTEDFMSFETMDVE